MYCRECGKKLEENAKYCTECGKRTKSGCWRKRRKEF
ncbi:zinc-ribbon domain-containing protein [Anaerostipes butyraticus]